MKLFFAFAVLTLSLSAFADACKMTQDLSKIGQKGTLVSCDETKNYPKEWLKMCKAVMPGQKMEIVSSCEPGAYATCTFTAEQTNKAINDLKKMGANFKGKGQQQVPAGGLLVRHHYTKSNMEIDKSICGYGTWKLK